MPSPPLKIEAPSFCPCVLVLTDFAEGSLMRTHSTGKESPTEIEPFLFDVFFIPGIFSAKSLPGPLS